MSSDILLTETDDRGVAWVTMNRPEVHNAFNDALIGALAEAFERLASAESVRAIVLKGAGKSFSAGADLDWMKAAAGYSEAENRADAQRLSQMLHSFNSCSKPTLALIQGAALGGGVGLAACADIPIAVRNAKFGFSEVRLGLIPATIAPYVVAKIGEAAARRYFLTGERVDGESAGRIGLVQQTVGSEGDLATAAERILGDLLACAPGAQAAAKELIAAVKYREIDSTLRDDTAGRIAERRATDEAREGMAAFFEKRKPGWAVEQ